MTQPPSPPPPHRPAAPPLASPAGKTARRARLPRLSADEWGAVAHHLGVSDLVSLSEASRILYAAATQEDQFRARVLRRAAAAPRAWSKLYRRYAALQHEPKRELVAGSVQSAVGVCAVADGLVFYSDDLGRLVGLPRGWRRAVGHAMAERVVPLGAASLALIRGDGGPNSPATLHVLDACTGAPRTPAPLQLPACVEPDATFTRGRTRRPVVAMSCGRAGDHLLFVRGGRAHVVCAADAALVRSWDLDAGPFWFGALVRAEDTRCDGDADGGERVLGLCRRCAHDTGGARYELLDVVTGRALAPRFELAETERLVDVVASRDGLWIARRVVKDSRCAVVWSSRRARTTGRDGSERRLGGKASLCVDWEERRHNVGWAGGTFAQPSCEFGLGADGGEARFMPCGLSTVGGVDVDGRVMRVVYGADGEMVDHIGGVRRVNGGAFDWARVSGDGRVLMAACQRLGIVSVFVLNEPRRALHSVQCEEGLREVWLVGDHWVVGVGLSGRLYEWHFGAFCKRCVDEGEHDDEQGAAGAMEQEDAAGGPVVGDKVRGLAQCRSPVSAVRDEWFVAGRTGRDDGDPGGG